MHANEPNIAPVVARPPRDRERGQSLVEYALILFVVVTIGVAAFAVFQKDIKGFITGMSDLTPDEEASAAAKEKMEGAMAVLHGSLRLRWRRLV